MISQLNKGLVRALFFYGLFIPQICLADFVDWESLQLSLQRTTLKATDTTSLYLWSSGLLGVTMAYPQDDEFRARHGSHKIMSEKQAAIGDLMGTGIPGVLLASAQYWGFDRAGGERHFTALISTAVVTYIGKYSFGRRRPGDSDDHRSFPSGHTSTTFATATVLAYEYGWPVALPAYAVAAFTGASRIADDAHWLSDTVAGAFIGVIWGRASALNDEAKQVQSWLPFYEQGRVGLNFVSHF